MGWLKLGKTPMQSEEPLHTAAPVSRSERIEVIPNSDALGAELRGVDLSRLDDATFREIHRAWLDHLVILIRDQRIGDADLIAFSRRFGELDFAPPDENDKPYLKGLPEIFVISNVVENGRQIGALGDGEAIWHTDMNYIDCPPMASVLYSLEVPPSGGDTGFCNMYAAYEELPTALRRRIEGLSIKHDNSTNSAGYLRLGSAPVTDVTTCPGAIHPIVRTHPETGRKVLYLGRRRNAYIMGLPLDESEALLDEIWSHATQDRYAWHHKWRVGDLLMWDNRCVMHRRDAFDPKARRVMHRAQIKGDWPTRG